MVFLNLSLFLTLSKQYYHLVKTTSASTDISISPFFTAFDSVKYTQLGKNYLRKVFCSDSMLNSFLPLFGQRHETVFVVKAFSSFSLLIYFSYSVWHIEVMFSDRIRFNLISNNMRESSIPFFSQICVICTVFMDALDLFYKDEIQLFLVTVIFPLTLPLSDTQKPLIALVKNVPLLCELC